MMRKMIVLGVALILSFIFCSVSAAVNLQKAIIGKWVEVKKDGRYGEQIEFLKDGTVIIVEGDSSHAGDYKFIGDNRIKIDLEITALVFEVSIDKQGQLIFTDPAGKVERYITKAEWEKKLKERFTSSDLTALDKETKLMWTRDANIAGKEMTWNDAFTFIESLNEQKYGGYSDWRLPSKEELETLINFAKGQGYTKNINGFFNNIGFKNMQSDYYWLSTTPHASFTALGLEALVVGMDGGNVGPTKKTGGSYVLLVRDGVASSSAPSQDLKPKDAEIQKGVIGNNDKAAFWDLKNIHTTIMAYLADYPDANIIRLSCGDENCFVMSDSRPEKLSGRKVKDTKIEMLKSSETDFLIVSEHSFGSKIYSINKKGEITSKTKNQISERTATQPKTFVSEDNQPESKDTQLQKLKKFITDQWKLVIQIPEPKRNWRELVPLAVWGKYDDYSTLYLMALNRRGLTNDALVSADKFLKKGDLKNAKKYADLATRHYIESNELFKASEQVFIRSVEMTAQTLEAMYRGPKEASKYGWFLMCGPKCYEVADYVFLMTDFAMDYGLEGMDEAKKNLIVNAFVKTLLKTSGVSKWIENRTTHLIGDSGLYGLMDKTINSPEFQKAFMKVVAESGAYTTQKMANEGGKKIIHNSLEFIKGSSNLKPVN